MNCNKESLIQVNDIGPIVADNIITFLKDPYNKINITNLLNSGIIINYPIDKNNNKIIVITGKFLNLSRDEIIEDITKLGYRVSNTVSKKTEFLICGEKPGSKQKKARDLGIQIIYENDLIKLLSKVH
jgi:DNA ligase (NAD+)